LKVCGLLTPLKQDLSKEEGGYLPQKNILKTSDFFLKPLKRSLLPLLEGMTLKKIKENNF
jgi:hypothetical protein